MNKKEKPWKPYGLCFRCEHRARNLESVCRKDAEVPQPRFECGQATFTSGGCYMFQPVLPMVVKAAAGDHRPLFMGWGFSARVTPVKLLESYVLHKKVRGGWAVYNKPIDPESGACFSEAVVGSMEMRRNSTKYVVLRSKAGKAGKKKRERT